MWAVAFAFSRPVSDFNMFGKLGLSKQYRLGLHGDKERRLVIVMGRILVEGCRAELVDAIRGELTLPVPGNKHNEGVTTCGCQRTIRLFQAINRTIDVRAAINR